MPEIIRLAKVLDQLARVPRCEFDHDDFATLLVLRDRLETLINHIEGDPA